MAEPSSDSAKKPSSVPGVIPLDKGVEIRTVSGRYYAAHYHTANFYPAARVGDKSFNWDTADAQAVFMASQPRYVFADKTGKHITVVFANQVVAVITGGVIPDDDE